MDIVPKIREKLRQVKVLALDSDGVMTDGGVYLSSNGQEFRRFSIKDGLGLKMLMSAGVHVAIVSSSSNEAVRLRVSNLGPASVFLGIEDKLSCINQLCIQMSCEMEEVAFIGDDLPDIPVLRAVGLPMAPLDASDRVAAVAIYQTCATGGNGAVREVCELILDAQEKTCRDLESPSA